MSLPVLAARSDWLGIACGIAPRTSHMQSKEFVAFLFSTGTSLFHILFCSGSTGHGTLHNFLVLSSRRRTPSSLDEPGIPSHRPFISLRIAKQSNRGTGRFMLVEAPSPCVAVREGILKILTAEPVTEPSKGQNRGASRQPI